MSPLLLLCLSLSLAAAERVKYINAFEDGMPVIRPPTKRRNAFECEVEHGCIPASSEIHDVDNEMVNGLSDALAVKEVRVTTTGAGNYISLSLPTSSAQMITCPDYTGGDSEVPMTISFAKDVPHGMFEGLPLLAAGMEFGCFDEKGEHAPVYARVEKVVSWKRPGRTVEVMVSRVLMTDLFVGSAQFNVVPSSERRKAAQSLPAPTTTRRTPSQRRFSVSTTLRVPADPADCRYSTECVPFTPSASMVMQGNFKSFGGDIVKNTNRCPTGFDNVDMFSVATKWDKNAAYNVGTPSSSDSDCSGDVCTCSSSDHFRYHCCKSTTTSFVQDITAFEFNANYDDTAKKAKEVKNFGTLFTCKECYGYLAVKAHFEVIMEGTPVGGGKYLIPTGMKKMEAYVTGAADFKLDWELKSGKVDTTLGPYTLLEKASEPLYTLNTMLGSIPVKVAFNFDLRLKLGIKAELSLPKPITSTASLKGDVKMGGIYDTSKSPSFTVINEKSISHEFVKPVLDSSLQEAKLTADLRITAIPTVYLLVYDLVPFEIELLPYVGVNLISYTASETGSDRKCTSSGMDLYYGPYFGLDLVVRMERPVTPDSWQLIPVMDGLFNKLVLLCRTADDAHTVSLKVGMVSVGSIKVLEGGDTQVKELNACSASDTFCQCVKDPGERSWATNTVYFLRYPSTGELTILPKTDLTAAAGCIGSALSAAAAAASNPPPPPAPVTISHTITYRTLSVESYVGNLKNMYEIAYAIGIKVYTVVSQWKTGVSITSSAQAARRAGASVTYQTVVPGADATTAQTDAQALDSATLVTSMNTAKTALSLTEAVPSAADMTISAPTVSSSEESSSSVGLIIGIILGVVAVAGIAGGAYYYFAMRPAAAETGGPKDAAVVVLPEQTVNPVAADPESLDVGVPAVGTELEQKS